MAWLRLILGCSHERYSFPQTIKGETTVSCLDCGQTMPYDWAGLGTEEEIKPPKMTAPKEIA
jgi:hypothetical protein